MSLMAKSNLWHETEMSTRKERVSNAFMMIRSNIKGGSDARAHDILLRIVETEIKKALEKKK